MAGRPTFQNSICVFKCINFMYQGISQKSIHFRLRLIFRSHFRCILKKNEWQITIIANYGSDTSTELNITFFKNTIGQFISNYEVNVPNGGTFDVPYTMKGGVISSMNVNQKNLSLEINIETNSDGNLDLRLNRDYIDSTMNDGKDIDFIVLIYEENKELPLQTTYQHIESDDNTRSISIPVKHSDVRIDIVGTHVVPEFGTIAMIVLAVAIVSIIAVSAKSRLSIMPRI